MYVKPTVRKKKSLFYWVFSSFTPNNFHYWSLSQLYRRTNRCFAKQTFEEKKIKSKTRKRKNCCGKSWIKVLKRKLLRRYKCYCVRGLSYTILFYYYLYVAKKRNETKKEKTRQAKRENAKLTTNHDGREPRTDERARTATCGCPADSDDVRPLIITRNARVPSSVDFFYSFFFSFPVKCSRAKQWRHEHVGEQHTRVSKTNTSITTYIYICTEQLYSKLVSRNNLFIIVEIDIFFFLTI